MNAKNAIEGFRLKVLILEDSLLDLELIKEQLANAGYVLDLTHVINRDAFTSSLHQNCYDIILSDFKLPGFDAFGALHISRELCPEVPFICVSGSIGEETAIELLKLGAVDYVLKDRPERLPFAVKRALDDAKEKVAHLKAANALRESEHRFKQVAENAQEWIWEVNKEGLFTYVSPVCQSLLGFTPNEIVYQKYFYDFFVPEKRDELRKLAFDIFSKKESFRNFENSNLHKNGQVLILTTSGSPIIDDKGNFLGYRGVDTDITEWKKTLSELLAAKEKAEESDKLKSAFLANMSHEIRTPMNGILGFSALLSEPGLETENQQAYISIIQKSGARMLNIISEIVDISRIESGTMDVNIREVNINNNMEYVYELFKPEAEAKSLNLSLKNRFQVNESILLTDGEKLLSILTNLIKNAIKYTDQGSIEFGYDPIEINDSNFLQFYVKDTGIGIQKNRQSGIFESFIQADILDKMARQGAGLGLSIAKAYVEMLNGEIWVESEEGLGSTFYFTLPYKTEPD